MNILLTKDGGRIIEGCTPYGKFRIRIDKAGPFQLIGPTGPVGEGELEIRTPTQNAIPAENVEDMESWEESQAGLRRGTCCQDPTTTIDERND